MTKVDEALRKYSDGKATAEETNKKLEELGSNYRVDPTKNVVTDAEQAATVVGKTPAGTTGFGMADMGLGKSNKVHIINGKIVSGGFGKMHVTVNVKGHVYEVSKEDGVTLL